MKSIRIMRQMAFDAVFGHLFGYTRYEYDKSLSDPSAG